jgi:hypothetical protein
MIDSIPSIVTNQQIAESTWSVVRDLICYDRIHTEKPQIIYFTDPTG